MRRGAVSRRACRFWPVAPVQLLSEGVQKIFEGRIDRAAPLRPPGSAFTKPQREQFESRPYRANERRHQGWQPYA